MWGRFPISAARTENSPWVCSRFILTWVSSIWYYVVSIRKTTVIIMQRMDAIWENIATERNKDVLCDELLQGSGSGSDWTARLLSTELPASVGWIFVNFRYSFQLWDCGCPDLRPLQKPNYLAVPISTTCRWIESWGASTAANNLQWQNGDWKILFQVVVAGFQCCHLHVCSKFYP